MTNEPDWVEGFDAADIGSQEEKNGLPESPASMNIKFWVEGYGVMLTMRDTKVSTLLKQLEVVVERAKENGWKPTWEKSEADGMGESWCTIHKTHMKQYEKEGRTWYSHKIYGTENWCNGKA